MALSAAMGILRTAILARRKSEATQTTTIVVVARAPAFSRLGRACDARQPLFPRARHTPVRDAAGNPVTDRPEGSVDWTLPEPA